MERPSEPEHVGTNHLRILAPQMGFMLNMGGGRYDYEQLESLARLGHSIRAILPMRNRAASCLPPGISCRWIRARGFGHPATWSVGFLAPCLMECFRFKPHIIRIHHPYYLGPLGIILSAITGIPAVISVLHFEESGGYSKFVDNRLLSHYDGVLTISKASLQQFKDRVPRYHGIANYVYPGIASDFKPSSENWTAAGLAPYLPEGSKFFLFVGALIARKNLNWLIDLFSEYVARGKKGALVIAGDGPQRDGIRQTIKDRELEKRIVLLGGVPEAQKIELYRTASALLFPSSMEGFGFAPAESMACGTPAIVSDRGSLPEIVIDGQTGYVLPVDQGFKQWIERMSALVDTPEKREQLGTLAANHVRRSYDWELNAKQTADLLFSVINRKMQMKTQSQVTIERHG